MGPARAADLDDLEPLSIRLANNFMLGFQGASDSAAIAVDNTTTKE